MKVHELIEMLQKLDQNKYVVISGYEGGCDFPKRAIKSKITLNQYTEWYYGDHEYEHNYEDGEWNGYILKAE